MKNISGDITPVTGQDVWFPDGTVCQSDKSLTSFCVEGRCEPFLCPSPAEGLQSEEGYPSLEEGRPLSPSGDSYPFLLHPALCQTAPSFIPGRPATDKVPKFVQPTTTLKRSLFFHSNSALLDMRGQNLFKRVENVFRGDCFDIKGCGANSDAMTHRSSLRQWRAMWTESAA